MPIVAPQVPLPRLSIGITGHRERNPAFAANRTEVEATLSQLFDRFDAIGGESAAPVRLHSLLVDGVDQMAMAQGRTRGWDLVAPLPFGRTLNIAINAQPHDYADADALLKGELPADPAACVRAAALREWSNGVHLFELADRDDEISALLLRRFAPSDDLFAVQSYNRAVSARVALAAKVLIEQSDLLVAVWDGETTNFEGGTGATVALALDMGCPVLWIDARAPVTWRLMFSSEALAGIGARKPAPDNGDVMLNRLLDDAIGVAAAVAKSRGFNNGSAALDARHWRPRSPRSVLGYRRIEALFGAEGFRAKLRSLRQTYETPDAMLAGSAVQVLASAADLPGQDQQFVDRVKAQVVRRFAWADGISSRLSDTYRNGMILNFVFSAFAIVGGIAYIPFATSDQKWPFALFELALLIAIVAITAVGQKRRWHGRWFETRRVAEYLRHAPLLLVLGVARPPARWLKSGKTVWPELYARHAIRSVGLPSVQVTTSYLRGAIERLLLPYVIAQRDYHHAKARRLSRAHRHLDKLSEFLFLLAIASVSTYLALKLGGKLNVFDHTLASDLSPLLTFLGVTLPTLGASIAGIRYFGDFERFSAISEVAAEQLDRVSARLELLLSAPEGAIDFARAADLAHAADDIVVGEIENWQAVFAGKHITVPV